MAGSGASAPPTPLKLASRWMWPTSSGQRQPAFGLPTPGVQSSAPWRVCVQSSHKNYNKQSSFRSVYTHFARFRRPWKVKKDFAQAYTAPANNGALKKKPSITLHYIHRPFEWDYFIIINIFKKNIYFFVISYIFGIQLIERLYLKSNILSAVHEEGERCYWAATNK